jgi:serine/threonine protein kinase
MPTGVVTCKTCGRDLRAGLLKCPHDGTPLGPITGRRSASELLRGPVTDAPTIQHDDSALDTLPSNKPLTGRKLGDYVVGGIMGSGGMGEVYEGLQPVIAKKVAIKVLKQAVAQDEVNVARMLSEARAVASIRHRSICDVYNFGKLEDGRPYIVMEYLDGEPLDQILRKRIAISPVETVELLEEICSALAAAHARNIVHRDLKPGNVFVVSDEATKSRYVKLLDFGLAKDHLSPRDGQRPATMEGFVVGTPDYIAPEQARGLQVTPKTDLYSLGVMAFEMVTGRLPFLGSSAIDLMNAHVNEPAPLVSDVTNGVPPPLEELIHKLLSKDPADRPESADAVRRLLMGMKRTLREGNTVIGINKQTEPMEPMEPYQELPTDPSDPGRAKDTQQNALASGRMMLAGSIVFLVLVMAAGAWFLLKGPAEVPPRRPGPEQGQNLPPKPGESPQPPEPESPQPPEPETRAPEVKPPPPADDLVGLDPKPKPPPAPKKQPSRQDLLRARFNKAAPEAIKRNPYSVVRDAVESTRGRIEAARTTAEFDVAEREVVWLEEKAGLKK